LDKIFNSLSLLFTSQLKHNTRLADVTETRNVTPSLEFKT